MAAEHAPDCDLDEDCTCEPKSAPMNLSGASCPQHGLTRRSEPTLTPPGDKFLIACPECGCYGTHTGICSWSFARRGEVWTFFAEKMTLKTSMAT